jgi:hypothetical protein
MSLGYTVILTLVIALVSLTGMQTTYALAKFEAQQSAYRYASMLQAQSEGQIINALAPQVQNAPNTAPTSIPETGKTALCPNGSTTNCPFYGTLQMNVAASTATAAGSGATSNNVNTNASEQRADITIIARVYAANKTTLLATSTRQAILRTYPTAPWVSVTNTAVNEQSEATTADAAGNAGWSGGNGNTEVHSYTYCQIPAGTSGATLTWDQAWCANNYPGAVIGNGSTVQNTSSFSSPTYSDPNIVPPAWTN